MKLLKNFDWNNSIHTKGLYPNSYLFLNLSFFFSHAIARSKKESIIYTHTHTTYMASRGSLQHRKAIIDYLAELERKGYRTINLNALSPDGIAVKDGKIIAVEVLLANCSHSGRMTAGKKRDRYFMFDEVFVKKVGRNPERDNDWKLKDNGTRW